MIYNTSEDRFPKRSQDIAVGSKIFMEGIKARIDIGIGQRVGRWESREGHIIFVKHRFIAVMILYP
jgi:hypothetical protein